MIFFFLVSNMLLVKMLLGHHLVFENEVPLINYFVCGRFFFFYSLSLFPHCCVCACVFVCVIGIKLTAVKMSRYNVCGELKYTIVRAGNSL